MTTKKAKGADETPQAQTPVVPSPIVQHRARLQVRSDTYDNWLRAEAALKILAMGEIAFVADRDQIRIGDGQTPFSKLAVYSPNNTDVIVSSPPVSVQGKTIGTIWFDLDSRSTYILTPHENAAGVVEDVWWPITAPLIDNVSGGISGDLAPIDAQSTRNQENVRL